MIKKRCYRTLALLGLCVIFTPFSFAQDQYQPGVIDRTTTPAEIPKSHSLDKEPSQVIPLIPGKLTAPNLSTDNPSQVIATLKEIRFKGVTAINSTTLKQVAEPYLQRPFTNADLATLKYDLTRLFYDKGYPLVRITTPPQAITDGILKVKVTEGRIDQVQLQLGDQPFVHSWIARAVAKRLKHGDAFKEERVESMVNDFNDLYNVQARVNLSPGRTFGTTNLDLIVLEDEEDTPNHISVDNYGSELTGEIVGSAHLEQGNILGLGEKFSLDLKRSDGKLWSYALGFQTPIAVRNVMLRTYYLRSNNDIGDRLSALGASGKTESFDVSLASKLVNTQQRQWAVHGGLEMREHESFLNLASDSKDNIRKAYVSTSYLKRTNANVIFSMLKLSKGVDMFGANQASKPNATRSAGKNNAWLLQPLIVWNHRPSYAPLNGTVKATLAGQFASDPLLSSDLFTVGGYGSVRGFEPAQEAAEAGYQFSFEYNHDIAPTFLKGWKVRFGPFLDGGAVYNRIEGTNEDNNLYSAGLGLELAPDSFSLGNALVRLDWANTLGSYSSDQVASNTLYIKSKFSF